MGVSLGSTVDNILGIINGDDEKLNCGTALGSTDCPIDELPLGMRLGTGEGNTLDDIEDG